MSLALDSLASFGTCSRATSMLYCAFSACCPSWNAGESDTHELKMPGTIRTRYFVVNGPSFWSSFPGDSRYLEHGTQSPPPGLLCFRTEQKMSPNRLAILSDPAAKYTKSVRPSEVNSSPVAVFAVRIGWEAVT